MAYHVNFKCYLLLPGVKDLSYCNYVCGSLLLFVCSVFNCITLISYAGFLLQLCLLSLQYVVVCGD